MDLRRYGFWVALTLSVTTLGTTACGQEEPRGLAWPFGPSSATITGGLDLFNLGILGGKANNADDPPPQLKQRAEGRRITGGGDPKTTLGPERLRVALIYPGGPLEKAGIKPGDVIVGVNKANFAKGSMEPLAAALRKGEAAEKPGLTLVLERGKKNESIRVELPGGKRDALLPFKGAARHATSRAALDWLVARQTEDGGFPATLCGTTGVVVQVSLAGLAWLGAQDAQGEGPYLAAIEKARDFVFRHVDAPDELPGPSSGPNWNQTNWAFVHAAIFLGELHLRRPAPLVQRELQRIATEIGRRQEASGGWAHGPGGKNALGYLELNIVSSLALSGLGMAALAGCTIDEKVLDKAMGYLEASGGGDGGVAYSTSPGQQGQGNIGRTAGSWLGAENLGLGKQGFTAKMRSYVGRHSGEIFEGHASLMQHILLAGVAASAHGPESWKRYLETAEAELVLARAPDGSLQPRPWHESISMQSNSDVDLGQVWTTAAWAVVLVADPKDSLGAGLPGWTGASRKAKRN